MAPIRIMPRSPKGSLAMRLMPASPGSGRASRPGSATTLEALADTRVAPGCNDVGQKRAKDEDGRGDEHRTKDDRVVSVQDGIEDELADPGPREHDFGEHSARKQPADAHAEERDRRQDRQPER